MLDRRPFWLVLIAALSLFYLFSLERIVAGDTGHWAIKLSVLLLVAHALELPLALHRLRSRNPAPLRLAVLTVLYGLLWWVPARRGLFAVR